MQSERYEMDAVLIIAAGDVSAAELQSRLRDLGYYDGPVEVEPWTQTLVALRKFQRDHGLPATGCPDRETMTTLRESYCF
jgi:peptidoglycan hydrolase-like protein with peptidoglycan-binding domain